MNLVANYRDPDVYKNALALAMRVFDLTEKFPPEERYSLTDQIRRSSRSVCANLAEARRKRRYRAAFLAKLSDAETEAAETQVWAELAMCRGYVNEKTFLEPYDACDKVIGQIVRMAGQPEKWLIRRIGEPAKRRGGETGSRHAQS